jgi:hypothetical protein
LLSWPSDPRPLLAGAQPDGAGSAEAVSTRPRQRERLGGAEQLLEDFAVNPVTTALDWSPASACVADDLRVL